MKNNQIREITSEIKWNETFSGEDLQWKNIYTTIYKRYKITQFSIQIFDANYTNKPVFSLVCYVFNPVTVNNFVSLFNCTPVGRASDSMMARHKTIFFSWFGPELFCLLLGPPGFNCWFSFAPVFQWCCSTPQGSPGVSRNTFLSSPHLCFITVFICDLFVSCDDPLMS